jgi:hypothetical protein
MGNILEEIIDRAAQDESFRRELLSDPAAATSSYNLTEEQLKELKAMTEAADGGGASMLDQRSSKFRLF